MKKNNTAEKAAIEAKKVSKALKESTEKTLRNIINEALNDVIANDDEDEELEDEESYEVEDVKTDEKDAAETETPENEEEVNDSEKESEEDSKEVSDEDSAEDEWADMEDFKVGDNDYDFTGADEEIALKVVSKLGDDDQIFIKKEDDGTYTMKDGNTDAEYVIELDDEEDEPEEDFEDDGEVEIELAVDGEDEPEEEIELELDEPEDGEEESEDEVEVELDDEEEKKEEELDENVTTAKAQRRKMVKTLAPNSGEHDKPEVSKEVSIAGTKLEESIKKMIEKAKSIQAENKQYKAAIESIKQSLLEAAALNVNYGKVVSLLVNETVTKEEKKSIVERFNNVKTIKEGNELYKTIKCELNESKKTTAPIVERQINAESKTLNETTIYQPSNNPSINLMERMERMYGRK